jgi:hypothetical protein
MSPAPAAPPQQAPPTKVADKNVPQAPWAWIFAAVAVAIFAAVGLLPNKPGDSLAVTPAEYTQLRDFTIFFITALLPSDALIRFGRGILFRDIANAKDVADTTPRATVPQILAFLAFLLMVAVTVLSDKLITADEYKNISDVVRHLIVALLPSEALIRVGRGIYGTKSGAVPPELMKKV